MNKPVQFPTELKEKTVWESDRFQHVAKTWLENGKGLYALLALSFTLKVTLFFLTDIISNDGPVYINQAIKFLEGSWREAIEIDGSFLYSLVIAAFGRLGLDLVQAGQVISLTASVLVLVPLYLLFRGIVNERVAFLGCLAFTLSPGLNIFSVAVMRDPLFLLVFAWLAYFAWRAMEDARIRYFVAISVLSVLSPLLRVEGLLIVPIIFLMLLVKGISEKRSRKPVLFGIGLFFVILGLVAYAGFSTDEFSLARQKRVQQVVQSLNVIKESGLFKYHPVISEKLKDMELSIPGGRANNDFADISRNHIGLIYFMGLISLVAEVIWFPFSIAFLFGLGKLHVLPRNQNFLLLFILPYLFMAYFHNIHFGLLEERYIYAPIMFMFLWVGIGLERILNLLCRLPFSKVAFVFFILFFFVNPVVQAIKEESKPEAISSKLAGEWLARHPELKDSSLVANGRKIPFYAGRRDDFTNAEFSGISWLKDFATDNNIDLIAIEIRKKDWNDALNFPGYSVIAKFENPRYVALIYRRN